VPFRTLAYLTASKVRLPVNFPPWDLLPFHRESPNGSLEWNESPWHGDIQRRRQLLRGSSHVPSLASLERMARLVYQNFFTRNTEPKFLGQCLRLKVVSFPTIVCYKTGWLQPTRSSQTLSPVQGSEPRILHWFSPTALFSPIVSLSQPLVPAQAHQPDDAPPKNRFSPTTMNTPTPPFNFTLPPTPQLFHMPPPARPGQHSPAAALYPDFGSLRDSSTSPGLFGIPLPPLRPSPSLISGSWSRH
jgi:hypothetical protein